MIDISVVIPTYKRSDLLKRLLRSIAAQTLKPKEVIVVDDCSEMTAEYKKVIEEYRECFPSLLFLEQPENGGAPKARNRGIRQASCDWVALVDDDDEWLPGKLKAQAKIIQDSNFKNLGLVYTWTRADGANGMASYDSKISVSGDARSYIVTTNFIMSASVIVKKRAIVEAGLFDEALPSCQDWDMWIRIFLKGYECDVAKEILTIYHRHGGESIGLSARALEGYRLLLEKHWLPILKYTQPLNWAKKSFLYLKTRLSAA
ncbi:glycosyltransferase family 2 protein [Halomonas sp. MCCC 1A17488]|uniref:glycosyltransferase family 2 protein n=1 Tax=unclassified Halomonas TaxID=2609666 RepID=UPI0018D22B87|nr:MULTISPECIES: glycosyltransferase family A protein [unclassified Halomonas]MCE8014832.1 glycosyltransferase family 2 protein [Halomonas sp. MCCC 1A17488]MCG3238165.1 glycosyltransferase family 2 protein [Halomonas sp. MCCC 1A17488]QPP48067.1 glycosyltransferase family 2 protein [Halomonas sp. SS10-MC5]